MTDFLLAADGDLDLSTNDLQLVEGIAAIRQELQIRYRFFFSEWFLNNRTEGIPYIQEILVKNAQAAHVRSILTQVATDTPGVSEIRAYSADLDIGTRRLTVSMEIGVLLEGTLVFEPFIVEIEV